MRTGRPPKPMIDRFNEKAMRGQAHECWPWLGGKSLSGYGVIADENRIMRMAHRVAYECLIGPIPSGHDCHHTCHRRDCVNPNHLLICTRSEHCGHAAKEKTHCINGHEYVPGNFKDTPTGRRCTICAKARWAKQRQRLRTARALLPKKPHANGSKTHCKRGHPFNEENTHRTGRGRTCKICWQQAKDAWHAKQPKKTPRGTPKPFCKHGHAMTPENTHTYKNRRSCKKCALERANKSRANKATLHVTESTTEPKTGLNQAL